AARADPPGERAAAPGAAARTLAPQATGRLGEVAFFTDAESKFVSIAEPPQQIDEVDRGPAALSTCDQVEKLHRASRADRAGSPRGPRAHAGTDHESFSPAASCSTCHVSAAVRSHVKQRARARPRRLRSSRRAGSSTTR